MAACIPGLDPSKYQMHSMHGLERDWPETNCYVDLWIEVLAALGHSPEAAFGFTVTQDFEGDQFTFFKPRPEDLTLLYDLSVQELTLYDSTERHITTQLGFGRLVLIEVDAFYLPDTIGVSYRTRHTKTTIAVNQLDAESCSLGYFHNARYHGLSGEDYNGIFRKLPEQQDLPDVLFPYAEFIRLGKTPCSESEFAARATSLLKQYLAISPRINPVTAFGVALERDSHDLISRPIAFYHDYAFNTVRQLGANFEVMASHLDWLTRHGEVELSAHAVLAKRVSSLSKSMLFQMARMASRRRLHDFGDQIKTLALAYEETLSSLRNSLLSHSEGAATI